MNTIDTLIFEFALPGIITIMTIFIVMISVAATFCAIAWLGDRFLKQKEPTYQEGFDAAMRQIRSFSWWFVECPATRKAIADLASGACVDDVHKAWLRDRKQKTNPSFGKK